MRRRAGSTSETSRFPPPPIRTDLYSHVTTYRSVQLELQIYSPSLKAKEGRGRGPLAVFSRDDKVSGRVFLDNSCHHTGRISVTLEGIFHYQKDEDGRKTNSTETNLRKHVFLSTTTCINASPANDSILPFQASFIKRRPSGSCLVCQTPGQAKRVFPFSFDLPKSLRAGEELPCSFTPSKGAIAESKLHPFEIAYRVMVYWEPSASLDNSSSLEVPILIHAESDFQSIDASPKTPEAWIEMPLKSERPVPYRSALTLPSPITFSRSSKIPYFVIFTTTPRNPSLAKEIAADASISVSLVRQIGIIEQPNLPPTPPITPSSDLDSPTSPLGIIKRVTKTVHEHTRSGRSDSSLDPRYKPLPDLPMRSFVQNHTLRSDMSIGFQKRPRQQCRPGRHPSISEQVALPDGLYKGKLVLSPDMLPCVDWNGLCVKYYLDISVLMGQDELRARVPLRII